MGLVKDDLFKCELWVFMLVCMYMRHGIKTENIREYVCFDKCQL